MLVVDILPIGGHEIRQILEIRVPPFVGVGVGPVFGHQNHDLVGHHLGPAARGRALAVEGNDLEQKVVFVFLHGVVDDLVFCQVFRALRLGLVGVHGLVQFAVHQGHGLAVLLLILLAGLDLDVDAEVPDEFGESLHGLDHGVLELFEKGLDGLLGLGA